MVPHLCLCQKLKYVFLIKNTFVASLLSDNVLSCDFAAINYVAICEALGVSPSVMAAGVAADNVICAIYFIVLFSLASKIPSDASSSSGGKHYLRHKNNIMRCLYIVPRICVHFL